MMLLRLAVLNLTRSVRRSVLSTSSVILGVAVIIVGQGVIGGFEENAIRAAVDNMTGHVQVRPADYPTNEGLTHPIDHAAPVDPTLAAWLDRNAKAWTPRLVFVAEVVHAGDSMPVRAIAIDPAKDSTVFPRDAWTLEGSEPVRAEDGLLVSTGVARLLDLDTEASVILQATTVGGAKNALEIPVAGVFNAGTPLLDQFGVVLTHDLGRQIVQTGDAVTHISVRLDDRSQTESFAAQLGERLPDSQQILTWIDECAPVLAFQSVRSAALNLVVFALMGMSATGIANTVLMAAYERIREIGTLRAMGMTRAGVMRLFVLEGALLGIAGGVLGALLGSAVVLFYEDQGIVLPLALANGHLPISTILYLRYSFSVAVLSGGFGLFIAVAASFYPAMVASRPAPAEAVRA